MTLLKLGVGFYVPTDEIVLLQSYPSRPAKRDKEAARLAGDYKDATTGGKKRETLRTLVHLRCGIIVGSPIGADALAKRPALETPVKHSTRNNNLENAHIEDGQNNGQNAIAPISPKPKAPRGRGFPDGQANPNARPTIDEDEDETPATSKDPNGDESDKPNLFSRLLGHTGSSR